MIIISGSINLLRFVGAREVSDKGEMGIFIPLDQNPSIYQGRSGAYAHIRVLEREREFNGRHYSHTVALDLPKAVKDDMIARGAGYDRINAVTPFIGDLESREIGEKKETPASRPATEAVKPQRAESRIAPDEEDLPF